MNIVEFFNPQSQTHLRQYIKYASEGKFDKDFLPNGMKTIPLFFKEWKEKIIRHHISKHLDPIKE